VVKLDPFVRVLIGVTVGDDLVRFTVRNQGGAEETCGP